MKDGVNRLEGIGESKGGGMGASLCDDVVGTKIFFRELLRRISGAEMFGLDEYLIADLEVQCQRSVFIGSGIVFGCWRSSIGVAGEAHQGPLQSREHGQRQGLIQGGRRGLGCSPYW